MRAEIAPSRYLDYARRMHPSARSYWPVVLVLEACGGSGEAADPSEILGEDLNYRGANTSAPSADAARQSDPSQQPASKADCERAAKKLVALGYDMAIAEETDPEKQRQLRNERGAALEGENAQQLVQTWTNECLERGDTKAETDCVARLESEDDITRCDPGP